MQSAAESIMQQHGKNNGQKMGEAGKRIEPISKLRQKGGMVGGVGNSWFHPSPITVAVIRRRDGGWGGKQVFTLAHNSRSDQEEG